jgi:predicted nucleic acid-binding protein
VNVYLDASVLLALLMVGALTARADAFFRESTPVPIVGDFAPFDLWTARVALRAETMTADIRAAATFLRRLDLTLRTADALNIAIAQRIGAALVTFDGKMAANAKVLGVPVVAA